MLPTVEEVLALDVVQKGHPRWVAGRKSRHNRVRWVHVSELVDIAHLLRGGELVLTTGVALPDDPPALIKYVTELAETGIAGLVVELGRHYRGSLPSCMAQTAERRRLPLIALEREVAFVRVTEVVHGRIIDEQLEELRRSEELHGAFTELALKGATPPDVLHQVAKLSGLPVVLENLNHQAIEIDAAGSSAAEILSEWESRSRSALTNERVSYNPDNGILVSRVEVWGEDWARLALICSDPPTPWHYMLVERATTTLALGRLVERDRAVELRQGQRTLLAAILDHSRSEPELIARAEGLGVPMVKRQLVGLSVLPRNDPRRNGKIMANVRPLADELTSISQEIGVPMLVGVLDNGDLRALCSLPPGESVDRTLTAVAEPLRSSAPFPVVIGAGSTGWSVAEGRRSLVESGHVAEVALRMPERPYHRLDSLGIHGLLHVLRDDSRLQSFIERELAPLLNRPAPQRRRLLETLDAYLTSGGNKQTAARKAHVSRSVLYERLIAIESLLGVDLSDPVQTTSLHVAFLAWREAGELAVIS